MHHVTLKEIELGESSDDFVQKGRKIVHSCPSPHIGHL